jgi:hypothetical protein
VEERKNRLVACRALGYSPRSFMHLRPWHGRMCVDQKLGMYTRTSLAHGSIRSMPPTPGHVLLAEGCACGANNRIAGHPTAGTLACLSGWHAPP